MSARGPHPTYPLWAGIVAVGALTALWLQGPSGPPAPPSAEADAGPPAVDAGPPPRPPLRWVVTGAALPSPGDLGACLREALGQRALVMGAAPTLTVTVPGLQRPQGVSQQADGLEIRTPTEADPRLTTAVHVATASCVPGETLRDADTGQQWGREDWPALGASGGAPLDAFVQVKVTAGQWRTLGLARFQRPELVAVGDTPAVADALRRGAATLFVAQPTPPVALTIEGTPARLVATAPWWPGGLPADHWGLAAATDAPFVPPAPPAQPPPKRPQPPRATGRRPAKRPRPAPAPRRPKRAPVFVPDYR